MYRRFTPKNSNDFHNTKKTTKLNVLIGFWGPEEIAIHFLWKGSVYTIYVWKSETLNY